MRHSLPVHCQVRDRYAMALGGPRWLGAVTPLGGLLFLAGWATLVWAARGVGPPQA